MLTKKDLEKIKQIVQEAVIEALTAEMDWEQVRDEKTGMPLAHPIRKKESIYLPAFWCTHLKFHEGAYRGIQEDVNKFTGQAQAQAKQLQAIADVLIGYEKAMRSLATFSDAVRPLLEGDEHLKLAEGK